MSAADSPRQSGRRERRGCDHGAAPSRCVRSGCASGLRLSRGGADAAGRRARGRRAAGLLLLSQPPPDQPDHEELVLCRARQLCRRPRQCGLLVRFRAHAYFAGFTLVGSTLLGMAMALVLNRRFAGRGLLRSFVLVPWAMAPVSVGSAVVFDLRRRLRRAHRASQRSGAWSACAAMARRRLSRPQPRGAHPGLEPGAADDADAAGGPAVDAGRACIAPRCWMAQALFRRFLAITLPWLKPNSALHLHCDDHQFADGVRHSLDHDARRPRRGDDGAVMARLSDVLPVPAVRRRREPALFPDGAELPAGDCLFRRLRAATRPAADAGARRRGTASHDAPRAGCAGPALRARVPPGPARAPRSACARSRARRLRALGPRHPHLVGASRARAHPHEHHARARPHPHARRRSCQAR